VSDFSESYEESYDVFKKYQMTVHNDTASDCTKSQFGDFLVDSPLCMNTDVCFICSLLFSWLWSCVCVICFVKIRTENRL